MKKSIKEEVEKFIASRRGRLVPNHQIEALAGKIGCLASTCTRKARELGEKHPYIFREYKNGITHYKYILD